MLTVPIVCGLELKASSAIVIVLRGTKQEYEVVETKFKKIELSDHTKQEDVMSFRQALSSFFESIGVSEVGIKARNEKGEFSGGVVSFKIEGIIQTTTANVRIIHPATISATFRKHVVDLEKIAMNKYQHEAFKVAYHLLGD
jgi:hypothetical protein